MDPAREALGTRHARRRAVYHLKLAPAHRTCQLSHFQQLWKPRRDGFVVRVALGVAIEVVGDGQVHCPKCNG